MLKKISLLFLFFLGLQDCAIFIAKQQLFICSIFLLILLLLFSLKKIKCILNYLVLSYKKTPLKYFYLFIFFMIITSLFQGDISAILKINYKIILIYFLTIIPTILFAIVFIPKYISYKKLLKYFLMMYQFIMLYGIFDFFTRIFHIAPLRIIHNLFSPRVVILKGLSIFDTSYCINRATSIFFEPSFFATFIFLFLPITYILYKSNIKIVKFRNMDKIFKIYLIVISWIALLLTQSPIYIIACIVYTLLFFYKEILQMIIKNFTYVLITLVLLIFCGGFALKYTVSQQNILLFSRVLATISSIGNLETLTIVEPSMATRVISTINTAEASKKHPFIGVGHGNTHLVLKQQYSATTTPLTQEIWDTIIKANRYDPSPNIFWSILLENGIIGTFLLFYFFILSIYKANEYKWFFLNENGLFLKMLIAIAINYIIISFYWSLITYPMMWFIYGLLNSYILKYKTQKLIKKQLSENIENCQI